MQRTPIFNSTNIAATGYDPFNHVLEIEFMNGGIYAYAEVPAEVATAFDQADSKGKFHHAQIKGRYEFTKTTVKAELTEERCRVETEWNLLKARLDNDLLSLEGLEDAVTTERFLHNLLGEIDAKLAELP